MVCVKQVHQRVSEVAEVSLYETELLDPIAAAPHHKRFFSSLDTEFNKVNEFYHSKEEESVQRGILLDKQMGALTEIQALLRNKRVSGSSSSHNRDATEARTTSKREIT